MISEMGLTHSEGIEAADPSTPTALLIFEGAVAGYSNPNEGRFHWRGLFDGLVKPAAPMRHLPPSAYRISQRLEHSDTASANLPKSHQ